MHIFSVLKSLPFLTLDFCGDLDMSEWVGLFNKLNKNVSAQEARLIFMQIDKNGSGAVSLAELVPVVFSKASRQQIKMITHYAGANQSIAHRWCDCVLYVCVCNSFWLILIWNVCTHPSVSLPVRTEGSVLIREKIEELEQVSISDIEQLFDAYDEESIGFVTVGHIKERVKHHFGLSESVVYAFLFSLDEINDDEMLNRVEFHRLLKPYITLTAMK